MTTRMVRIGNDTLDGGADNDTPERRHRQQHLPVRSGRWSGYAGASLTYDTTSGKLNTLQFKSDVAVSDVTASRSGNNLILSIAGTDSVTVEYFFYSDDPATSLQSLAADPVRRWHGLEYQCYCRPSHDRHCGR